jgi:hypothetical protein
MGKAKKMTRTLVRASGGREAESASVWTARIEQSLSLR